MHINRFRDGTYERGHWPRHTKSNNDIWRLDFSVHKVTELSKHYVFAQHRRDSQAKRIMVFRSSSGMYGSLLNFIIETV
ncbi:hypothetical protein ABKN59_001995 [Abortiporus biennis]